MSPASKVSSTEAQGNLDSYIKNSLSTQNIQPLATSQEVRDRGSTFIANLFPATSSSEARARIAYVKSHMHGKKPATHEIAAWRCMVLKPDRNGLAGPDDFELNAGNLDDGEKWAGTKIQKVMESHGIIDAVVVVSRWYGGTMLGPARFSHIETCATEVCLEYRRSEDLRECISDLTTLDAVLAGLRAEYSEASLIGSNMASAGKSSKEYANLDLEKAKRLVKARENAIRSVQQLLIKRRETNVDSATGPGRR